MIHLVRPTRRRTMRKENLIIGLLSIIAIALVAIAVEPMFTPRVRPGAIHALSALH